MGGDAIPACQCDGQDVVAKIQRDTRPQRGNEFWLQDVQPCIDERLTLFALFNKTFDPPTMLERDGAFFPARRSFVDRQRGHSTPAEMGRDEGEKRLIDQDVAVEDEKGALTELRESITDSPSGAKEDRLDDDRYFQRPLIGRDEGLQLIDAMVGVKHHSADALPLQVAQVTGQERLASNLHEDLRLVGTEGAEAGPSPCRQYHRGFRSRSRRVGEPRGGGMRRETAIVTGAAGFIGSHVADALIADGVRTVALDDLSTGRTDRVPPEATLEYVDIADQAALDAVADAARPAAIFHLGAQSSVTVSVSDPKRDCVVNVIGTLNLLEAAKRHRAPVVFASTGGALYGNEAPIPTPEDFIPAPLAPYGASKWAGEAYVLTWARAERLPHAVCRLGNVYGARQSPFGEAGVVAILSHCLWHQTPPTLFGYGRPTRDYVHVSDVVTAMLAARGKMGVYNVSTGVETEVQTIFDGLQAAAGTALEPVLAPLRAGELERSCMDPSRARHELGWRAQVDLPDGLMRTYPELVAEFEHDRAESLR
jgi:UDP-glucose 4-epimerase